MTALSEKTQNNYKKALARLSAGLGHERWDDTEAITKYITGLTVGASAKKSYYCAVMSAPEIPITQSSREAYAKEVKKLAESLYEVAKKQELTEKEEAKYVPWADVLAVRDKMKPETPDDFFAYQDWIILCLYTMMPPLRADYAPLLCYSKKQSRKPPLANYIVFTKKPHIVLKQYKTQKTFGDVVIPVPPVLAGYLEEFWELTGRNEGLPLLWNTLQEEMSEDNLSERVISIFQKQVQKKCGISMLRHSYITMMRSGKELTYNEKEALARSMLHSTLMNELYRRPDAPEGDIPENEKN